MIREFNIEIVLIPHVICDFDILDDDLRYLKEIKDNLPEDVADQVILIDKDIGFMGIKNILTGCDILIAARMHCAINGLEAGIPTILVSYSQKALGMAYYIYNNDKWVISLDNTGNKLLKLVNSILLEKKDLNIFLNTKIEKIRQDLYNPLSKIEKLIQS